MLQISSWAWMRKWTLCLLMPLAAGAQPVIDCVIPCAEKDRERIADNVLVVDADVPFLRLVHLVDLPSHKLQGKPVWSALCDCIDVSHLNTHTTTRTIACV